MARHVTVSDSTDQRTLTKSAKAVIDDTPEGTTQRHTADITAEYFPGRLGFSPWG